MTLQVPVAVLIALGAVVLILAMYRKFLARNEDDTIHLGDVQAVSQQQSTARTLRQIDRIGISLTVITVLYGCVVAAMALYRGLSENGTLH